MPKTTYQPREMVRPEDRRTEKLTVTLTPAEMVAVRLSAVTADTTVSNWTRDLILAALGER